MNAFWHFLSAERSYINVETKLRTYYCGGGGSKIFSGVWWQICFGGVAKIWGG